MKRLLFIVVTTVTLGIGASAASADHQQDWDCDGLDDTTGLPMEGGSRANGVCGGVY